jgi:hypothetical protein
VLFKSRLVLFKSRLVGTIEEQLQVTRLMIFKRMFKLKLHLRSGGSVVIQTLEKSLNVLQEKSLNENFKKIGHNLIFHTI